MKLNYCITDETLIGDDYKFIRKLLNMSQLTFSNFIEVNLKTVQRIEKSSKVSKKTLKKTVKAISNIFQDKQTMLILDNDKLYELTKLTEKIALILDKYD